jgi:hypothetical protein
MESVSGIRRTLAHYSARKKASVLQRFVRRGFGSFSDRRGSLSFARLIAEFGWAANIRRAIGVRIFSRAGSQQFNVARP